MRNNAAAATKYFFVFILAALAVGAPAVIAQGPPIFPDASRIEGTWNMEVQWRTCADGTPQLQTTPELVSFARGGVTTVLTSPLFCGGNSECTNLGVWRHLGGRSYVSTFKRFRRTARAFVDGESDFWDPVNFDFVGSVIVVANITHEPDDTLTVSDRFRFYDANGDYMGQDADRCRTATGTRFTGEN